MARPFFLISLGLFLLLALGAWFWPPFWWGLGILLPLFLVGLADLALEIRRPDANSAHDDLEEFQFASLPQT